MGNNKYAFLFRDDMTTLQLRGVYFALCDTVPKEDEKELWEAYNPVMDRRTDRDITAALKEIGMA